MVSIQAMKGDLWLKRFLGEVGYKHEKSTLIFTDSQRNLVLLKNPMHHLHKTHRYLVPFVREHICSNNIECQYCSMKKMNPSLLTKGVTRNQFETCKSKLGLVHLE
jgi:hypothetical protein